MTADGVQAFLTLSRLERPTVATLKDGSIEFETVWDTADDDLAAIRDSFLNRTGVEFTGMGGAMNVLGSQGLRATCMVTNFSRNESLGRIRRLVRDYLAHFFFAALAFPSISK
jgi:hypothetical protein